MAATDFTLTDLLVRNAREHGDRTAFVHQGRSFTHRECLARTIQLAAGLRAAGVASGDRVAILARNRIEFLDLLGAAARLGAIVSAINWRLSAAEIALVLEGDAPTLVFTADEFLPLLEVDRTRSDAPDLVRLDSLGEGFRHAADLYLDDGCEPANVAEDDPLMLIHTAWSDQRPKAAMLTHRNLLVNALQLQQVWSLTAQDVHLCCLPLFHSTAISLTLAAQMAGGSSVLMPAYQAEEALALIGLHGVSMFAEFAPMLGGLLDAAAQKPSMLASVRHVCGLDTPETQQRLETTCPAATFWTGYGQTEAAGMVTLAPRREASGSVGRPLPLCAVEIVNEQGDPLPVGERGEITVRGPGVFAGYWQRPADNAQVFRSGRLHTGDSGHVDTSGLLWYGGRLATKELIKTGGENVYPEEVEAVLRLHPHVADAAVIGVADAQWGEAVHAICVASDATTLSEEQLIDFVGERIARYKRPRTVVFAAGLPKKADGSNDRDRIKQLYG